MNNFSNNNNNNYNNYNGTYDSQFPIWWSGTDTCTTSDNITFTASTDGTSDGLFYSGNILSLTANTTWNYHNNYEVWPKGIQDPSTELKYTPKWHIILGYKSQIHTMWD